MHHCPKWYVAAEAVDPSEQELQHAEGGTRRELRDHVAAEVDRYPGQLSLCVGGAHHAGAGEGGEGAVGVVGDDEVRGWSALEA